MLKCQRRDSLFKSTISGTTLGSPQSRGRFSSTHNVKVTSSGYPQSLGQHNLGVKHNLGDSARMPTILGSSTISRSTLGDPQSRGQHLETHNLGVSAILGSATILGTTVRPKAWGQYKLSLSALSVLNLDLGLRSETS